MKCYHCQTEIPEAAVFCPKCGKNQGFTQDLIDRATQNDQQALTELYQKSYAQVYATVKGMVKDDDAAMDIVQDAYVKGFESLTSLDRAGSFRAWIKTIARNKAIDYLRKEKPVLFSVMTNEEGEEVDFEDERPASLPEVVIEQQETTRLLKEMLDVLPEDQRACISMFYYEDMSIREIASSLGVSENTVKSRLNYGKKKIKDQVEELEKKGTKLYGLGGAPIALLLLLFRSREAHAAEMAASSFSPRAAAKEAGRAAKHTASVAGTAAAGTAGKGLGVKVAMLIAALAVAGGGTYGALAIRQKNAERRAAEIEAEAMAAEEASAEEASAAGVSNAEVAETTVSVAEETETVADEVMAESVSVQEVAEETTPADELVYYESILEEYRAVMGGEEVSEHPNVNFLVGLYPEQDWCYALYDIDNNGIRELIIAEEDVENTVNGIYTLKDRVPVTVLLAGERNPAKLGEEGQVLVWASGGAQTGALFSYLFTNTEPYLVEEEVAEWNQSDYATTKNGEQIAVTEVYEHYDTFPVVNNQLEFLPIRIEGTSEGSATQEATSSGRVDNDLRSLYAGDFWVSDETDWIIVKEESTGSIMDGSRSSVFHLILPAEKLRNNDYAYFFESILDGKYLVMHRQTQNEEKFGGSFSIADTLGLNVRWGHQGDADCYVEERWYNEVTGTMETKEYADQITSEETTFERLFAPIVGHYEITGIDSIQETASGTSTIPDVDILRSSFFGTWSSQQREGKHIGIGSGPEDKLFIDTSDDRSIISEDICEITDFRESSGGDVRYIMTLFSDKGETTVWTYYTNDTLQYNNPNSDLDGIIYQRYP